MDGISNPMPLPAGAVCYFSPVPHRRPWRREIAAVLAACDALHRVVDALQRHRAAACARLAGDAAAGRRLAECRQAVTAAFCALRERAPNDGGGAHSGLGASDLALLDAGWRCLAGEWPGFTVEQCQAHHARLVDRLLHRLAEFAEPRLRELLGDDGGRATARNYAVGLPGLAESLYRAELLGFAVTGSGAEAVTARVRLSLSLARVEAALGRAREAGGELPEAVAAESAVHAVAQAARRLLPLAGAPVTALRGEFRGLVEAAIAGLGAWRAACAGRLIGAAPSDEDDDGFRLQAA